MPYELSLDASVQLAAGIPIVSDAQLTTAMQQARIDQTTIAAVVDENEQARLDGLRAALALLAIVAVLALFFTNGSRSSSPAAASSG